MNQRNDDFVEGNIGIDTNSTIEEKIILNYQKQQQRQYRGTSTSPSLLIRSSTAFPLSSTNKGVVGPTTTASKKRYSSTSDDEPPSTRKTSRTSSLSSSSSTAVRTLETSSVTNATSADTSSRRSIAHYLEATSVATALQRPLPTQQHHTGVVTFDDESSIGTIDPVHHVPSASKPHTVTPSYSDPDSTAAGGSSYLLHIFLSQN